MIVERERGDDSGGAAGGEVDGAGYGSRHAVSPREGTMSHAHLSCICHIYCYQLHYLRSLPLRQQPGFLNIFHTNKALSLLGRSIYLWFAFNSHPSSSTVPSRSSSSIISLSIVPIYPCPPTHVSHCPYCGNSSISLSNFTVLVPRPPVRSPY